MYREAFILKFRDGEKIICQACLTLDRSYMIRANCGEYDKCNCKYVMDQTSGQYTDHLEIGPDSVHFDNTEHTILASLNECSLKECNRHLSCLICLTYKAIQKYKGGK